MPPKEIPALEVGDEINNNILKHLKKCFATPSIHNTKFIIGSEAQEFVCNGAVLAIVSPIFRDLLFYQTKKCKTQLVLPGITPTGFAVLVRVAFALDPKISPDNVVEAIHAAVQCGVEVVQKLAMQYLSKLLEKHPAEYLVVFLDQANQLDLPVVVSQCMKSLDFLGGVKHFLSTKQF